MELDARRLASGLFVVLNRYRPIEMHDQPEKNLRIFVELNAV